jgi:Acetyltransferase (GNAT) domain
LGLQLPAKIAFVTESKALYLEFCASGYLPMHLQPWWLDAVCLPEHWEVALVVDGSGAVVGALPWYKKMRWGLPVLQMPPFTTYAGPWLRYPAEPNFKLHSRYAFEKKVLAELIQQLPRHAFFLQNFRPEVENWLPFYWEGFQQSTRYTYIFEDTSQFVAIMSGMKNTLRSDLKKAENLVEYHQENDAWQTVFQLNAQSFLRKKLQQPYPVAAFKRLHEALSERQQMACFIARDRVSGEAHAGLYLAFDGRQAAVLLTGIATQYKGSCAIYGLFWEAVKFCGKRGLSLDFEGSMEMGIEHTFRSFGAKQQPYFQVWHGQNRFLEMAFLWRR